MLLGGKREPACRRQSDPGQNADGKSNASRTQPFLQRPERVGGAGRLDHHDGARIKTKVRKPGTIETPGLDRG